jgi:hypothetical protein
MPRLLWRRFAPVLVAVGIGGALLAPVPAHAAGSTVTFHGGCGLLGVGVGAVSHPDTSAVTVPAGSTVTFVNRLGESGELMINGASRRTVPADGQVGVVFQPGQASVSLVPACLLGIGGADSVTVTVTPVSSAAPSPGTSGGRTPAGGKGPADPADQSLVSTGATPVPPAPALTGSALTGSAPTGSAPTADAGALTSPAPVPSDDAVAAVGPAVPGPPTRRGPSGALVFTAAICVVGVSIAAGRAIIARRAIRSGNA